MAGRVSGQTLEVPSIPSEIPVFCNFGPVNIMFLHLRDKSTCALDVKH